MLQLLNYPSDAGTTVLTAWLGISVAFVEQVSRSSSKTKREGSSQLMNRHTSQ